MKTIRILAAVLSASAVFALSADADIIQFDLQGVAGFGLLTGNEQPTQPSSGGEGGEIGSGIFFDTTSNVLTINIGWGTGNGFATDLTGNASAGHIHNATASPAPTSFTQSTTPLFGLDSAGAPAVWNPSASNGSFSGSFTLTDPQETQLFEGRFYINIHTPTNGGGEIRGNIVVPEPATISLLAVGAVASGIWLLRYRRA